MISHRLTLPLALLCLPGQRLFPLGNHGMRGFRVAYAPFVRLIEPFLDESAIQTVGKKNHVHSAVKHMVCVPLPAKVTLDLGVDKLPDSHADTVPLPRYVIPERYPFPLDWLESGKRLLGRYIDLSERL